MKLGQRMQEEKARERIKERKLGEKRRGDMEE